MRNVDVTHTGAVPLAIYRASNITCSVQGAWRATLHGVDATLRVWVGSMQGRKSVDDVGRCARDTDRAKAREIN